MNISCPFTGSHEEATEIDLDIIGPALNDCIKNQSAWFHLGTHKIYLYPLTEKRIGHIEDQADGKYVLIRHGTKVRTKYDYE